MSKAFKQPSRRAFVSATITTAACAIGAAAVAMPAAVAAPATDPPDQTDRVAPWPPAADIEAANRESERVTREAWARWDALHGVATS